MLSETRSNTKDSEWSAVRRRQYVHAYLVGTGVGAHRIDYFLYEHGMCVSMGSVDTDE